MHLSLERLVTTVMLLVLAMSIIPNLFFADPTSQTDSGPFSDLLITILRVWAIDLVAIALSVDETSLSLSVIPFVCIFPVALSLCIVDYEVFASVIGLVLLTIVFIIARYIANSM